MASFWTGKTWTGCWRMSRRRCAPQPPLDVRAAKSRTYWASGFFRTHSRACWMSSATSIASISS
jgi:hypothetical protein